MDGVKDGVDRFDKVELNNRAPRVSFGYPCLTSIF